MSHQEHYAEKTVVLALTHTAARLLLVW